MSIIARRWIFGTTFDGKIKIEKCIFDSNAIDEDEGGAYLLSPKGTSL